MDFKIFKKIKFGKEGFSILEILVSLAILAMILAILGSFILSLKSSNSKAKSDREALENARRILDVITYEVKGAKSVYTPTTTSNQLSLETYRYSPTGETVSFIDFFLCGTNICLKKESQNPYFLNSDTVEVTGLSFSQVLNGSRSSVKISLTVNHKNPNNQVQDQASVTLTSTVSTRSY